MRDDLHVDARLVHLAQPQLAEIIEALEHLGVAHALAAGELCGKLLVPVMFFQRDHRAFRPWQHDILPSPGWTRFWNAPAQIESSITTA